MGGKKVLVHVDGNIWRVDNSVLQSSCQTLSFRQSKRLEDKVDAGLNWGSTVEGIDTNGGWLKVLKQDRYEKLLGAWTSPGGDFETLKEAGELFFCQDCVRTGKGIIKMKLAERDGCLFSEQREIGTLRLKHLGGRVICDVKHEGKVDWRTVKVARRKEDETSLVLVDAACFRALCLKDLGFEKVEKHFDQYGGAEKKVLRILKKALLMRIPPRTVARLFVKARADWEQNSKLARSGADGKDGSSRRTFKRPPCEMTSESQSDMPEVKIGRTSHDEMAMP